MGARVTGATSAAQAVLGIDTGGTFTDLVLIDHRGVRVHKVLSTPQAPEQAILAGIRDLGLADQALTIVHGSTVATNAVLEGKGVACAFVSNRGFSDMLTLGRQNRPRLYDLSPQQVPVPVARNMCLEIGGRIDASGQEIEALDQQDLDQLLTSLEQLQPRAVAVCLLFSYLNDAHERRISEALANLEFVSCSSALLPQIGEYERAVVTWLNAYVGPLMQGYLARLCEALPKARLAVMQSSACTVSASQAGAQAVHLLLSGPAGGLAAARYLGELCDQPRLLSFDMGGTSTDVSLINGTIPMTSEGAIGPFPVAVPMVDMHTIGAGGGSLALVDTGGMLMVGPESAGADPGPACYGAGGGATVTDANLVLGRLPSAVRLGGRMELDRSAASKAFEVLGEQLGLSALEAAQGVVELANAHMAQALRVISVERGHDPADYSLCCFGGAGGLHVCALAEALGMDRALAPVHAGVLSALGMLCVAPGRELTRTVCLDLAEFGPQLKSVDRQSPAREWKRIEEQFSDLARVGIEALSDEGIDVACLKLRRRADLRYRGQSAYLSLDWDAFSCFGDIPEAFHAAHLARFGHQLDRSIELVNLRVSVAGPRPRPQLAPVGPGAHAQPYATTVFGSTQQQVPVWRREDLQLGQVVDGPAVVTDQVGTTCIDPGWRARCDHWGNLLLRKAKSEAP